MRLIACYVEGFGCLCKKEYSFHSGLTQFFAENGEGKSTLAAFLKAMLYGMKSYRKGAVEFCDREHYYPFDGGKFGGNLVFTWQGKEYRVERFFGAKSETDDTLTVYENGRCTDALGDEIGLMVLGVDKASFERTLFIGGGDVEIGSTPCINAAFAGVATDGDEQSVRSAVEAIEKAVKFYKKSKAGRDKITEQTEKIARLNTEIDNAAMIRDALKGKYARLEGLQANIAALATRLNAVHQQNIREEQWTYYQNLQNRIAQAEGQRNAILQRYPAGLPSYGEAQEVKAAIQELDRLGEPPSAKERRVQNFAVPVLFSVFALMLVLGVVGICLSQIVLGVVSVCFGVVALGLGAVFLVGERRNQQALDQRENEYKHQKTQLQTVVTGFENRYGRRQIEEVLDDIKELARLQREIDDLRKEAEEYKRQKSLDGQPTLAGQDSEALAAELKSMQREEAKLLREIEEDERQAERLDELESEKRTAMELLAVYRQKHRLLQAAGAFLTAAERQLNERYVQPILQDFLHYADILERVLGEKLTMTREFELRFERGGEQRSERYFSAGQKSLCALCFRLAMVKNLYAAKGKDLPFLVLDDPFMTLDELHLQRASVLVKELSQDMQVVYMTCHPSRKMEK